MVDHEEFRNFCKSLDSCFEMMSRNAVKGDCLNICNPEKEAITHIPETNEGRVAVSADMWMPSFSPKKERIFAYYDTPHQQLLEAAMSNYQVQLIVRYLE